MRQARSARRRHFRDRAFAIVFHSRVTLEELRDVVQRVKDAAVQPDANGDYLFEVTDLGHALLRGEICTIDGGLRIIETARP